jgi:hypothetical protein
MFRQFAIARFVIGFIIFVLTYMVAMLSYDNFFKFLTVFMFLFSLYVMSELQKGRVDELAKKDAACALKVGEIQEQLDEKEAELNRLIQAIIIKSKDVPGDDRFSA